MKIRAANRADISEIGRLLRQVLDVHHFGRPDLFKANAKKYADSELEAILRDPKTPVFVAQDDADADENGAKILGYAFCVFQQRLNDNILTDVKSLYIDDLCVDEIERGKGVGRALYEYVLAFAKSSGCYNVTLNVWACNESARRFYENLGLTPQKIGMETILQR